MPPPDFRFWSPSFANVSFGRKGFLPQRSLGEAAHRSWTFGSSPSVRVRDYLPRIFTPKARGFPELPVDVPGQQM